MLCREFHWSYEDLMNMPETTYQAFLRITTMAQKKMAADQAAAGR
jgi:hypothetical protein